MLAIDIEITIGSVVEFIVGELKVPNVRYIIEKLTGFDQLNGFLSYCPVVD